MLQQNQTCSEKKVLGRAGEKIPSIGFGTYNIKDFVSAERALLKAIELGAGLIEVSDLYAYGLAMDLIRRVLSKVKREEVFIVFRVDPTLLTDPQSSIFKVEQKLRRMGVTYVDVIMPAGYSEFTTLETLAKALEAIVDKELARYIGLGDFKLKDIVSIMSFLHKYEISMVQSRYSVLNRRIEKDLIPFSSENRITILACTALERGNALKHPMILQIAGKYNATPAQVALSYIASRPNVVALTKSENVAHIVEDIEAAKLCLKEEDLNILATL
jgi:diketogulonate reductase-like aldo/keto reductase